MLLRLLLLLWWALLLVLLLLLRGHHLVHILLPPKLLLLMLRWQTCLRSWAGDLPGNAITSTTPAAATAAAAAAATTVGSHRTALLGATPTLLLWVATPEVLLVGGCTHEGQLVLVLVLVLWRLLLHWLRVPRPRGAMHAGGEVPPLWRALALGGSGAQLLLLGGSGGSPLWRRRPLHVVEVFFVTH